MNEYKINAGGWLINMLLDIFQNFKNNILAINYYVIKILNKRIVFKYFTTFYTVLFSKENYYSRNKASIIQASQEKVKVKAR